MRIIRLFILAAAALLAALPFAAAPGEAEALTLPGGLRRVGEEAFLGDAAIRQVVIPEGVIQIEREAFAGCANLKEVWLPASLEDIDESAFEDCPALTAFCVQRNTWACEWALQSGVRVLEASSRAVLTAFSDDAAMAALACAETAEQIALVRYTGGSRARLSVHEKKYGMWRQLFEVDAYVGRNGIEKTREGDKRTPTGTFNLTTPFGIKADPGAVMPYLQVTNDHYWCGTSGDPLYNQLVDCRVTGRAWRSGDEHLIDYAPHYNYCMFIDYNAEGRPGLGSCIFLHCKGKSASTSGCVAVDEQTMVRILRWARPGAKIVIR